MDPIDLSRLREFSDGTDHGVRYLAALFLGHMDECVAAIRAAVEAGDGERIRTEAHRGAGTAGACGARGLSTGLLELESLGAGGQVDESSARLPAIEREVKGIREFLDRAFDTPPAGEHAAPEVQP